MAELLLLAELVGTAIVGSVAIYWIAKEAD